MRLWYLLLVSLAIINWANAQIPENPISFSKAREIILSQNAGIKSVKSETDAAGLGVITAGAIPNPSVSLDMEQFGTNEIELAVEQTIELGDKRNVRKLIAQKQVETQNINQKITHLELDAEINRRFIPIITVLEKIHLLDSIISTVETTRNQIIKRLDAGASRKSDLLRIEIELDQLNLQRSDLSVQYKRSKINFASLGNNDSRLLEDITGSINDSLKIPSLEQIQEAYNDNPHLQENARIMEEFELQKKLLNAEAVPDLDISLGYLRNNEEKSNAVKAGLSIEIPVFNKNREICRQLDYQKQAVYQKQIEKNSISKAEFQDLHNRLIEIDHKLSSLGTVTLPKAKQLYSTIREYYESGNTGFFELMESQKELLELQMTILEIKEERAQIFTDLMHLTSMQLNIVQ